MKKITSLIIPILLASGLFAQITIVASVDKNPVSIGENFQLKYTVINYSPNKLNTPLFIGFEIVSGPSKTESMVLRNNEETISGTVTYTLKALQSGTFKIGKATLTDSSKTFASEEISLVVTDTKIVDIVDEPRSTTITPVLSSNDSLYFKDGTVISGKGALVQECVSGMGKKKKKRDELNVDADAACTCMMEKIAKHYTYAEFLGDGTKNGGNLFTRSQTENPEAYKDMLSCVFENMGEKANNDGEKNAKSPSTSNASSQQPTGDFMEKFFVDACVQAATKSKEYKQMNVDANSYCQCTWDKIQDKGLSLDKLGDLNDPNSPLFNEIITPCIMAAIKGKKDEPQGSTTFLRNPDDIKGANPSETVSLTKLMNVYKLKVAFGSIEKYFTLDSGANDVFISSDFERDLLLEGLIKKSDYLTARTYRMADGSQVECRRLKLSNIKIGGFTVNNVIVAITENANGMLLLGKSLLDKFSDWKIDNQKEQLILTR
ncbi:MAG: BatD family protein [Chitinophagales bacterium]|jgi:hypothetical protein|nr:BatD family protein [Chitinophagales bacterium]